MWLDEQLRHFAASRLTSEDQVRLGVYIVEVQRCSASFTCCCHGKIYCMYHVTKHAHPFAMAIDCLYLVIIELFQKRFHKYWIKWSVWVALACSNNAVHGAVGLLCHVQMIPQRTIYIVAFGTPTPKNHSPILKYELEETSMQDVTIIMCNVVSHVGHVPKAWENMDSDWVSCTSSLCWWFSLNKVFWLGCISDKLWSMHVYSQVQFIHGCLTVENNNVANESFANED